VAIDPDACNSFARAGANARFERVGVAARRTRPGLALLGSYVARARTLRRRLLVERDLLSFGQPSEVALHCGPMEEELLPAFVADEPEPLVVNDPFNPS
jgi:hypothetical protein